MVTPATDSYLWDSPRKRPRETLFGSVTSMDIAKALQEQEGITIDKKKIEMPGPIKQAGTSQVVIKLYQDVSAKVRVKVTV